MKPRDQQLDQFLDQMLAEYGKAEPRVGLENRVLAKLEREGIAGRRRWWWLLGTVSATALVAAVVWMGSRPRDHQANFQAGGNSVRITPAPATSAREGLASGISVAQAIPSAKSRQAMRAIRPHAGEQGARATPKLDQFPTPAPLSEQERILARYVSEYREQAVLVARAQTELRNRERREELETQPRESQPARSDQ